MARVGRLAGAVVVYDDHSYFMVGDTKEPVQFQEYGFKAPDDRDAARVPVVKLESLAAGGPQKQLKFDMEIPGDGHQVAALMARVLVIRRNGSVSERLWNLVTESSPTSVAATKLIDAGWLQATPEPIWEIVRDTVLKCT